MNGPVRPRTRRHALALRAQERRELQRRSDSAAAASLIPPGNAVAVVDPRADAIEHLTSARVAALKARRVNAVAHINEAIRILERS